MGNPEVGVNPILVSMLLPSSTAKQRQDCGSSGRKSDRSAGVTLDGHDHSTHLVSEDDTAHDAAHDHENVIVLPKGSAAPTLDIEAIRDGAGWNLRVITTNFTLTPERIGGAHVPGEGHGHVYINGVKLARLYGEWYHIDKVPDGDVKLRVTLNSNDHSALAVGEMPLEATMILPGS